MIFSSRYTVKVNEPMPQAIEKFEKYFYNMENAGYTFSTRIIHADYSNKKFTGRRIGDGIYKVRAVSSVELDSAYRHELLNELVFSKEDDGTTAIMANVKHPIYGLLSIIFLIVAIALAAYFAIVRYYPLAIVAAISLICAIIPFAMARASVNKAHGMLEYVMNYDNK